MNGRERRFFKIGLFLAFLSLLLFVSCAPNRSTSVPAYNVDKIINNLPEGQEWLNHLREDLLPFWTMKDALGEPVGNFPTYRSNKGELVKPDDPPPEYKAALEDPNLAGLIKLERNYVRAQARQTFAYGISYHLTGNESYLKLVKKGVDYLRQNAIDRTPDGGGAYTFYNKNSKKWGPDVLERTSQDMAYALSGIGFYYYLTHDPDVLDDIIYIKNHIFNTYYDYELDLLRWVIKESPDDDKPNQKEIVSQLDQIYGYMLWLTPSLPDEIREVCKKDLEHLASIMIEQFFSVEYHFFWGQITKNSDRRLGADHTDFGHSIKTLWLIYRIGIYTNNIALVNFARENAKRIIDVAYIEKTGSWARRFDKNGKLDHDKEWWSLAELDQTTATLGLNDPSLFRYLEHTYQYWLKYMVDHENHGIWHMVSAKDNKPILKYPKVHSWKNAFHVFEHALICYMTTHQIKDKPIKLYYAFKNKEDDVKKYIHPYFYFGKCDEDEIKKAHFTELTDYSKYEVEITDLR